MAMEDPVTHVRQLVNSPSDVPPRAEASNFAVYSDGVAPTTTALVSPTANANGWNNTSVTVSLDASDLAERDPDTPTGWVDQLQYSLPARRRATRRSCPGTRPLSESRRRESRRSPTSRPTRPATRSGQDPHRSARRSAPVINGLPARGCSLWPVNHKMLQVAVVRAADTLSGVASLQVTATSSEPSIRATPTSSSLPTAPADTWSNCEPKRLGFGPGRLYTLTATASDLAGNVRTATATCAVPHDQR